MRYLVDSDVIADYLKGRPGARSLLDPLFPDGLAISIITYAEVYEGIFYGHDRAHHERGFRQLLRGVSVLGLSRVIARLYATVRGALSAQGQLVGQPDLFIAATALHYDLTLITRNRTHFERVPGLSLYQHSTTRNH